MTQRTCDLCGTSIAHRHGRAKYCGKTCGARASRLRDPSLHRAHQAKYRATPKGRASKKREQHQRTCITCGETWMATRANGKYCSYLCRDYDRWGPQFSAWPRVEKVRREPKPKPAPYRAEHCCAWCGSTFQSTRPDRLMCDAACKKRAARARRRAREVNASGAYTWAEVTRLWLSIGKRCAYCSEIKGNDEIEPDHVHPLSRGGSNSIHNIAPSCSLCNSDKRDLTLDEWVIDRARRGLAPRDIDPRLYHQTGTQGHDPRMAISA